MLTIILLATFLPVLAGVAYLAMRNRLPQLVADARGIALQTVIVIVVLLAIAGAVSGVLLTRAGDVTTELEQEELVTGRVTSSASCAAHKMGAAVGLGTTSPCTWTAAASGVAPPDVTAARCSLVRGTYTAGTTAAKAKCVVTY